MTPQQPQQPDGGLPAAPAPALLGGFAQPAAQASAPPVDNVLRWVKESVAALIGIALVVCLVVLIWRASDKTEDVSFQRVKDLLLFVNPLVGVVIGYYFNRVSTEARAENAERAAQGAEAARGEAQLMAQQSQGEAEAAKSALEDIIPAAQTLLSQVPAQPAGELGIAAAGAGGSAGPLVEARVNLRMALERARAAAGRRAQCVPLPDATKRDFSSRAAP